MEQPTSNPRFCTNNCGFYGSPQFEGMCSKCYRDHVSCSLNNSGRSNPYCFYGSSNSSVTSTSHTQTVLPSTSSSSDVADQSAVHDDQDDVVGRLDEDNIPNETTNNETTVKQFDDEPNNDDDNINQNSESSVNMEESMKTDPTNDVVSPSNDTESAAATASIPITISRNIDIPTKNESNISLSVMETSSLGAESMSPVMASSVDKKKRNRCSWQSCNKKLGLTGFDCRCGGQFCPLHRYANEHNCTFDYKEHGQHEIRKNMPVVQAPRIRPI